LFHFFSNRAAAFLQLVKLSKALADAETTITLNPKWEKVLLLLLLHNISFSDLQTLLGLIILFSVIVISPVKKSAV
jgi:hypothetical protein